MGGGWGQARLGGKIVCNSNSKTNNQGGMMRNGD